MTDLAALIGGGGAPVSSFAQGEVIAYTPATGANTIRYRGTDLADLPILDNDGVIGLTVGDAVILIRLGASLAILGRLLAPGDPRFAGSAVGIGTSSQSVLGFALSTTATAIATRTLTVPSWANWMDAQVVADATVENPTAASDYVYLRTRIEGTDGGENFMGVAAAPGTFPNRLAALSSSGIRSQPVTPLATVTFQARMRSQIGAWSAIATNILNINVFATFRKL